MEDLESIFRTAHRELRPKTPIPEIKIEFFPFAGLNHTARLHENRLMIRVSDVFTEAPADIYFSLALILLAKLYRKKIDHAHHRAYRKFILSEAMQERARHVRSGRSRPRRTWGSRGRHVDLSDIFSRLNHQYFGGSLERPHLSWSAGTTRRILGRFDITRNTIFISRLFDTEEVPLIVIEYVMFHEMLHVKHQCRVQDSRLIVHTPAFRAEEKRFAHYLEAKQWLRQAL